MLITLILIAEAALARFTPCVVLRRLKVAVELGTATKA
jgi:hypothetical protein